jgi:hypothetical protein
VSSKRLVDDRRMLSREQRLPVVVALREQGHSNVAIGKALGVSEGTVRSDLQSEQVRSATNVEPERVTGLDGKTYPARQQRQGLSGLVAAYAHVRTLPANQGFLGTHSPEGIPARGRRNATPAARQRFLEALREGRDVKSSAAVAACSRSAMYARRAVDPGFRAEWDAALEAGTAMLVDEGKQRELARILVGYGADHHRFSRPQSAAFAAMLSDGQLEHLLRSRAWRPPTVDPGAVEPERTREGQGGAGLDGRGGPLPDAQSRSESPATERLEDGDRGEFFAEVRRREAGVPGVRSSSGWSGPGRWGEWGRQREWGES